MSKETFAGEPLDPYALKDEITRLRAELAAVTEERDRMRQRVNSMIVMLEMAYNMIERPTHSPLDVGFRHSPLSQKEIIQRLTETCLFVRADLSKTIDEARAALEGVTESASPWRDIESAPKDGTNILVAEYCDGGKYPEDARWDFWVDSWRKYASGLGEGFGLPKRPTVWMPMPEPPR